MVFVYRKARFMCSRCITLKKALQALTIFILHSFCLNFVLYTHVATAPYTKYNTQDTFLHCNMHDGQSFNVLK